MTRLPTVSIMMPTFNSARYIAVSIDSVRCQSLQDWEFLIVDGGSRDSTVEIVRGYSAEDPRVRLIPNTYDKGPAHARSTGLRHAMGEYVAFLDNDDLWLRD